MSAGHLTVIVVGSIDGAMCTTCLVSVELRDSGQRVDGERGRGGEQTEKEKEREKEKVKYTKRNYI